VLTGGADVVLRGNSTSERQSLVECKLKTMGAKIGASHSPLLRLAGRRGPRAFVRSDPGAKPEAFILDRRLFSARGARHVRPCGRPPTRVRDCAKSCGLWD